MIASTFDIVSGDPLRRRQHPETTISPFGHGSHRLGEEVLIGLERLSVERRSGPHVSSSA
jgi:hypothetical protein